MNRSLKFLLAASAGLAVANLYYHQPLLADLARAFGISSRELGIVSMLAQIGYALGMLFIVPLGDYLERRSMIVVMLFLVSGALVAQALAQNWVWLACTSFLIGFTTISPQLMIPMAAHLAPPQERGAIVGTLMSGLLLGILLSRTLSGWGASIVGWRAVYWVASALMALLALVLARALPKSRSELKGSYGDLMKSMLHLIRTQPIVREASFIGAMIFGSFSAFWTSLALYLESPTYHLGSQVAGLFGIIGAVGALSASVAGRWADRGRVREIILAGIALIVVSFGVFMVAGSSLIGLALGVVLLDLGLQGAHVTNLSRIYNLIPDAKSRLNTIYMVSYFLGGALGSFLGAFAWNRWQWPGVCAVGALLATLAFIGGLRGQRPSPTAPLLSRGGV